MENILPRGLRNNNPLNIKINHANHWLGKVKNNTDGTFEQFDTLSHGFRAAFILIRKYIEIYHLNTIEKIIRRWSPDGHEGNYINAVCSRTCLPSDYVLDFSQKWHIIDIVCAMACFENGVDDAFAPDVVDAYDLLTQNND